MSKKSKKQLLKEHREKQNLERVLADAKVVEEYLRKKNLFIPKWKIELDLSMKKTPVAQALRYLRKKKVVGMFCKKYWGLR
jgi:hypothetical protein